MNLADLYSTLETVRRNAKGLLSNPTDTLNQWGNQIKEDLGQYDQGNARAMGLLSAGNPSAAADAALQNNMGIGTGAGLLGLHIAYHGTPHEIPFGQGFDMSKIGTGEGAQAFGHGLYFAENPSVAKSYAAPARTPAQLRSGQGSTGGNLYKVDINADPAHYLDWDKPLSQQNQRVQDLLGSMKAAQAIGPERPAGDVFSALGFYDGIQPKQVPQLFTQAGIPGIKYKDAGSRGTDSGTHNYVVFDDSLINNLGPQP